MNPVPANLPNDDFPPIQNAALFGLGAIGILYASQIVSRDPSALRVVADPARIARYLSDPPSFNGRRLDLAYVSPDQPGPPADLVLVAVKSAALPDAIRAVAPFLHGRTQILPLLNGISAQDVLAAAFGAPRVLRGFVYCESSMRAGNAVVQHGENKIVFGEAVNDPPAPRVRAVADFLARLGVRHDVPADMLAAQWRKFILNVGINQAQALLRAPCRELQQNLQSMRLARTLMDEAAAVGAALGVHGAADVPAWAEDVIRRAAPDNKTSMLQDVEAGRPTEVDLFADTVCRLGRVLGIPTPANDDAARRLANAHP